jgi:hypothetical protein
MVLVAPWEINQHQYSSIFMSRWYQQLQFYFNLKLTDLTACFFFFDNLLSKSTVGKNVCVYELNQRISWVGFHFI